MRTILYSLVAIFLFGIIAPGFIEKANSNNSILIQSVDKNISSDFLTQSAKIISGRLKDFSPGKYDVTIIPENNQIRVVFSDTWDLKVTEDLIIHKGTIEFYETYNRENLVELLNGDNHLFTLLSSSKIDNSGTKMGCTSIAEVMKVNDYLKTLGLSQKCKFAWAQDSNSTNACLYALKINSDEGPVMTGNDIESAKYDQDRIWIKLQKPAVKVWADVTKRNINNVIALVLDNNVISAPKVMDEISSGEIEISGKFTQKEAGYIAALLNNGELPLSFKVIK